MAAGDETVIGPYPCNASGVASAAAEMDTAFDGIDDTYTSITGANGQQFWIIHIEAQ
jgi:hypothetical protein